MMAMGFPCGSDSKESTCNAGDPESIAGLEISPGEGNGNPLQYSCLENSMAREAWRATVFGITKSHTRLSNSHTHTHTRWLCMSGIQEQTVRFRLRVSVILPSV